MNSKKNINDKDKNQFKMISTTTSNTNIVHNTNQQLYYVNESDDLAYNEKRSAHNALERQRREGLNNKFQELAHVLPSLRQVTRPSKSLIVAKSLEFVSKAEERETDFQSQIQALKKENEQLMRQAQISKKRKKKKSHTTQINSQMKPHTQRRTSTGQPQVIEASPSQPVTTTTYPIEPQLKAYQGQPIEAPEPQLNKKKKRAREKELDENDTRPTKKKQQQTPPIPSNMMQHNTNNLNDQLLLSTQYNMDPNYMYINSIPATNTPISHTASTTNSSMSLLDSFLNDDDLFQWH